MLLQMTTLLGGEFRQEAWQLYIELYESLVPVSCLQARTHIVLKFEQVSEKIDKEVGSLLPVGSQ